MKRPDRLRAAKPEDVEIQPIIRSSVNLVTIYATVNDKSYPIARDLYMYTSGDPTGAAHR